MEVFSIQNSCFRNKKLTLVKSASFHMQPPTPKNTQSKKMKGVDVQSSSNSSNIESQVLEGIQG